MAFQFSERSEMNLKGVNHDLIAVCRHALLISPVDFAIVDGLRTKEEEAKHVADGKSQTMNSRHLTGHAVDVMAYDGSKPTWEVPYYLQIMDAMRTASYALGIKIECGGDWKTLRDYGHFQLSRETYP